MHLKNLFLVISFTVHQTEKGLEISLLVIASIAIKNKKNSN